MKAKQSTRGFTLVELMIVIAIVGVLSGIATFGVLKYVSAAKGSEAMNAVGQMARSAAAAYIAEHMAGDTLALTGSAGLSATLCGDATNTVPVDPTFIKGRKYQSSPSEWATGNLSSGWECLKFSMESPQYYMYQYEGSGSGAPDDEFVARGMGDLDGDGELSTFELRGRLIQVGTELKLATSPTMSTDEPGE